MNNKNPNLTTLQRGNTLLNLYYDGVNRLTKVQRYNNNVLELTASYQYDCFSRRISKTITQANKSITTYYGWQGDNLTTEQTNNQQTTIVYQPNTFTPLFKIEQNTHNPKQPIQLAFYQVDHLGTPLRLINELSHIIWQADPDDWRAVKNTQGTHQPLRYQGQYEDQETGLYYNRYRYYSPDLGRYISHDPIGLAGGFDTYNYVTNPNNWVDPMGLDGMGVFIDSFNGPWVQQQIAQQMAPSLPTERFLGDNTAMRYLVENNCDAEKAWSALRQHRYTYPGLIESDRNAEHYLFAVSEVNKNSYAWAPLHIMTDGYSGWKAMLNFPLWKKWSPYKGSPVTWVEIKAGHYGSQDGLFGTGCQIK